MTALRGAILSLLALAGAKADLMGKEPGTPGVQAAARPHPCFMPQMFTGHCCVPEEGKTDWPRPLGTCICQTGFQGLLTVKSVRDGT